MNLLSKKLYYIRLMMLVLASLSVSAVHAQKDKEDVRAFLAQAQRTYKQAPYLDFRVKYLYTNAGAGARPMDSLSGEIQMDKGRSRQVMDGTETVVTGRYVIRVMSDEKVIYLSSAGGVMPMDPTQILDTVVRQMKGVQSAIVAEGRRKVLTLRFPPGGMYTYIRMVMDTVTGYFQQMTYGIRTASLVSQDQISRSGHPGAYEQEGQIDLFFSNYEKGRFGDALFDERNFFTHAAGKYEPAGRYKDYHIFLASSNL